MERRPRWRHAVSGIGAALVLAGCGSGSQPNPSTKPAECRPALESFGVHHASETEAEQTARKDLTFDQVIAVVKGHIRDFEQQAGCGVALYDTQAVWAVVVDGDFPPISCGPPRPRPSCPAAVHTGVVFVRYGDAGYLMMQFPAPSQYRPLPDWTPA